MMRKRYLAALAGALAFGGMAFVAPSSPSAAAEEGYKAGVVRAEILSDSRGEALSPVKLPDGTSFTPYKRYITVRPNESDLRLERARELQELDEAFRQEKSSSAEQSRAMQRTAAKYDAAIASTLTENCGFWVVQRLPDVAIGEASQDPICDESDPVDAHFWGYSGQVYSGLSAAGWSDDYCGPGSQPKQYLWLEDSAGAYGFYQNYAGRAKGACAGTRNHARLWEVYSNLGVHFSVGTAHREQWDWGDNTHHVVYDGWHQGRDALINDWPTSTGVYFWSNYGYWGSGGYYSGWAAELGCYSPFGC